LKLTTLEIKGFKSFAEKTNIDFQDGVTAIVGPNGCGKSNIVDAIRWVLGEQSTRSLRSEKMENVIFNGTSKRKPSNLAEVSLSFDNSAKVLASDYSHITLTRKLFRSGDSEYRLNDVPCRLKDITDLFLDTGIGSDSYSIIELRMVEELISNKEGSRRTLFEEAAGIAKYRVRKKQTHSKLRDTQDDLERVEDVLFEISKNLKSLEQQAKRTEKYYRLKDQFKDISILISIQKIRKKKEDWSESEKTENKLTDEILSQKAITETLESEMEKKKLDILNSEKQLSVQQKAVNQFRSEIQRIENEQRFKNEKIKTLSERKEKLESEILADQNLILSLEKNIEISEGLLIPESEKLKILERNLPELKLKLDELQDQQKAKKTELDQIQLEIRKHKESAYQFEKELDRIAVQVDSFRGEQERNLKENEAGNKELVRLDSILENIHNTFSFNQENLEIKRKRELDLTEALRSGETQMEKIRDEIASQSRSLDSFQNEYNLTKSLVDSLEGFPESIIFLKKKADWLKSIPLLSDIIFCPEEYRIAIENYLEPYMNFFVVQNRDEAEKAIELLSSSSKGRANFFILEDIQKESEKTNYPKPILEKGDWVPVMDIVEVDIKYRKLVEALLGQVVLGSSIKDFLILNGSKDFVFLEKRGIFFSSGHRLSGGSIGLFEGKRIGRSKNLEILQKNINQIKDQVNRLNSEKDTLQNEILAQKKEMESLKVREAMTELSRTESERNNLVNQKENILKKNKLLDIRNNELIEQIQTLKEKEESIIPQLNTLKDQIIFSESGLGDQNKALEEFQELGRQSSQEYNSLNLEFHQVRNRIASIEKDLSFHKNQKENLLIRKLKLEEELHSISLELAEHLKKESQEDPDFLSLYEEMEKMELGLTEMESEYNDLRNSTLDHEKKISEIRRKREALESELTLLKEKRRDLGFELKFIGDRMGLEFSISPETWEEILEEGLKEPAMDPEFLKEKEDQAGKIKNQLDNYGAINPLAMEAFGEIQTRYQFIQSQKEDLLQAKASLMETMAEIDLTAREKFMEAFTSVRENFIKVFRTLFNEEDSCDLVLLNPSEPLDSEIEIIARPKGKRPLTINQLSGGEKTLTATAILFSLYLLKPAPFCIFDEVDAPLDDTNIDKFNSIIREFSANSQFIVVSHNKKTISSTDIIYGVTMAEAGISKVVAVDLRKAETAA